MRLSRKAFVVCLLWSTAVCALLYPLLFYALLSFLPEFTFLAAVTIVTLFLFLFSKAVILYLCFSCQLKENQLEISSGFFIRSKKHLCLTSAVGAKLLSTPLMRRLKLTFVLITFEGSVYILPPVSADFATIIIDNIEERFHSEKI